MDLTSARKHAIHHDRQLGSRQGREVGNESVRFLWVLDKRSKQIGCSGRETIRCCDQGSVLAPDIERATEVDLAERRREGQPLTHEYVIPRLVGLELLLLRGRVLPRNQDLRLPIWVSIHRGGQCGVCRGRRQALEQEQLRQNSFVHAYALSGRDCHTDRKRIEEPLDQPGISCDPFRCCH